MTPVELLARLAALVPPPRYPLVRTDGVLAAHSNWRGAVVPRPAARAAPATCPAPLAPPTAAPNRSGPNQRPNGADAGANVAAWKEVAEQNRRVMAASEGSLVGRVCPFTPRPHARTRFGRDVF
jgi:hypothetical protein